LIYIKSIASIPAPKKPAFVKEDNEDTTPQTQDQPYYVPIYNYSPNKAYYNAFNRLGPNVENLDDKEEFRDYEEHNMNSNEILDKDIVRTFKFNRDKPERKVKKTAKYFNTNRVRLPFIVKRPKHTEIYFNPDDYLDLDYYFGRTGPSYDRSNRINKVDTGRSSVEQQYVNPYWEMNIQSPKDYLSNKRQLLFANHAFGLSQKTLTEKPPFKQFRAVDGSQYKPTGTSSDISVDYFFSMNDNNDKLLRTGNESNILYDIPNYYVDVKRYGRKSGKRKRTVDVPKENMGTIKEILSISDTNDMVNHMEELLKLKVPIGRETDPEMKPIVDAMKKMIDEDSKALEQYDWLGSTIDVLSAIKKLTDLM
jgi:hypothetical protein